MRKKYTKQEKAKIVLELLREEKTVNQITAEYGVHPTQLAQWKKTALEGLPDLFEHKERELKKVTKEHQQEVDQLYKKIGDLTIQVDWLKKNLTKLSSSAERRDMVDRNNSKLSVVQQARLLTISRSSLYYKQAGPSREEIDLKHRIDEIYTAHPVYGSRRIKTVLRREGYLYQGRLVGRKLVQRCMQEMGISGVCPGPNLSRRNHKESIYPYLLRNLKIERPNQVWGIDITYIRLTQGWMYLVAIIDWYSRYVVSWELSPTLEIDFVLQAVIRGFMKVKPDILNSDQGSHFTSVKYVALLHQAEVKISMDGKGRAIDNIFTERFFRSLKWEDIYLKEYQTPREAKIGISNYIQHYNWERPHQSLNDQTPAEVYFSLKEAVA